MIERKKEFYGGLGLMTSFTIVLVIFFSPLFAGHNGLDYLDNLYNSISKGSAYYISKVKEETDTFKGSKVMVTLELADSGQAERAALLYKAGGADVDASGAKLHVTGDLGTILENCLADADAMYHNDGKALSGKYGYREKLVLYTWWTSLKAMEKDLKKQKHFKAAKAVALVIAKAVETSYNYYQIAPQSIGDRWGIVLFSLVFYVIYTMWYGFAFMFMFEGWGMKLGH
jgi:hypothetical protein